MFPAVPRIPLKVLVLLFIVGLGTVALDAAISGEGWTVRFADAGLDVVAGALFALAGVSVLVDVWRWWWWSRRTQWIVVDLLDQAIRHVRAIAVDQLQASKLSQLDSKILLLELKEALDLPMTPGQTELLGYINDRVAKSLLDLLENVTPVDKLQNDDAAISSPDLEAHADALWSIAVTLYNQVGFKAEPLLEPTAKFAIRARELADSTRDTEVSGAIGGALPAALGLNGLSVALIVAGHLDAVYRHVEKSRLSATLEWDLAARDAKRPEADRRAREYLVEHKKDDALDARLAK